MGDVHPHCRGSLVQGMAAHDHEFKTVPGSRTMAIHYDRFQEAYNERKAERRQQTRATAEAIESEFVELEKKLTTEASLKIGGKVIENNSTIKVTAINIHEVKVALLLPQPIDRDRLSGVFQFRVLPPHVIPLNGFKPETFINWQKIFNEYRSKMNVPCQEYRPFYRILDEMDISLNQLPFSLQSSENASAAKTTGPSTPPGN